MSRPHGAVCPARRPRPSSRTVVHPARPDQVRPVQNSRPDQPARRAAGGGRGADGNGPLTSRSRPPAVDSADHVSARPDSGRSDRTWECALRSLRPGVNGRCPWAWPRHGWGRPGLRLWSQLQQGRTERSGETGWLRDAGEELRTCREMSNHDSTQISARCL